MEGKILPSRAHEHVVREDKDESPGRTRASHPGGQGRVNREDKSGSPGRTKMSVLEDASGALEARRTNPLSDSLSCLPVILKNEYYANAYLVI